MNPFLPKVEIKKVSLLPKNQNEVTVKLELKIIERTPGDFSSKLMKKYFQTFSVKAIFLNHEKIYNEIASLKSLVVPPPQGPKLGTSKIILAVKKATGVTSTSSARLSLMQHSYAMKLGKPPSLANVFKDLGAPLSDDLHAVGGEAHLSYSIDIPKITSFLGVAAFVEMNPFSELLGPVNISAEEAESFGGEPSSEVILENGQPKTIKIQDFRSIYRSTGLNTTPFQSVAPKDDLEKLLGFIKIDASSPKTKKEFEEGGVFSDLLASHDANGAVRFCFFIDFENLFKKYGLASNLSFVTWANSAYKAPIYSFKIKRRQVLNKNSKTVLEKSEIVKFLGSPKVIITTEGMSPSFVGKIKGFKLKSNKNFNKVAIAGGFAKKLISGISEMQVPSQKIRMFQGVDNEISTRTGVTYQYGVEMKIEDPVLRSLILLRRQLNVRLIFLKDHYVYDSFIFDPTTGKHKPSFNPATGEFEPEAKEKLTKAWKYMTTVLSKSEEASKQYDYFGLTIKGDYFTSGKFFSGVGLVIPTGAGFHVLSGLLSQFLEPIKATPSSINLAVTAISNALTRLDAILNSFSNSKTYKKEGSPGYVFNTTGKKGTGETKTISVEYWFPTLVEKANTISGYEFFSPHIKSHTGLAKINKGGLHKRLVREKTKLFNKELNDTDYAPNFMSVDKVCINSEKISIDSTTQALHDAADKILMEILQLKQGLTEQKATGTSINKTNVSLSYLLGKQNCTFGDFAPLLDPAAAEVTDTPFGADFGPDDVRWGTVTATDSTNSMVLANTATGLLTSLLVAHNRPVYKWETPDILFWKLFEGSGILSMTALATQRNILGEYIVTNYKRFTTSPDYLSLYWMLFENIVTLQQLNINDKTNVAEINFQDNNSWVPLDILTARNTTGKKFICRVRPVIDKNKVSLKLIEQTKLPIFNKYFVLET